MTAETTQFAAQKSAKESDSVDSTSARDQAARSASVAGKSAAGAVSQLVGNPSRNNACGKSVVQDGNVNAPDTRKPQLHLYQTNARRLVTPTGRQKIPEKLDRADETKQSHIPLPWKIEERFAVASQDVLELAEGVLDVEKSS